MSKPLALCIMGPTASGKTDLAIELSEMFPFSLISVDSALVYRDMDIGTAKPDAETMRRAPHRLVDIRSPEQSYSAAEFRADALTAIEDIRNSGRIPLLVGGTTLYFQALLRGLSPLPAADATVRARLDAEAAEFGWPVMHQRLTDVDPEAAARIHPRDPQRIQRALEVFELSGRTMTELTGVETLRPLAADVLKLVVCPQPRTVLHQRIEQRLEQMLRAGFIDEVKQLRQTYRLHAELPSMRSVGYRQAWGLLEGEYGQTEFAERTLAATRQLGKRQLTWLRQESGSLWYDLLTGGIKSRIFNVVESFLENRD